LRIIMRAAWASRLPLSKYYPGTTVPPFDVRRRWRARAGMRRL